MEDSESQLIEKLKNQLDKNGFETSTLDCGKLFHKLGKCYRNKRQDKDNLLACAVFYAAALQRDNENDEARKDLQNLSQHLLNLAKTANPFFDLIAASNNLKSRLASIRARIHTELGKSLNIPEIVENFDGTLLHEKQDRKIDEICAINDHISEEYIPIFSIFAEEIFKNLGIPPCRYCFVRVKPLDFSRLTPFSEFKGMILLGEGVEKQDYADIVEYFSWFETMFNFGIVNLGETSINDVNFPGFQNLKPKFKDRVVSPGVSWNKFSLKVGNTEEIGLVNTVQQMEKYLYPVFVQENCQGNSNNDIAKFIEHLSETQFIFGDRELHDQFLLLLSKAVRNNYEFYNNHLTEKLVSDYIPFNVLYKCKAPPKSHKHNVRRMLCTSSDMFVGMLGKMHECENMSCFDILTTLRERNVLSHNDSRALKYALALSCEVRLKSYFNKFHQNLPKYNRNTDLENLMDEIGIQSAVDYFAIMSSLQDNLVNNNGKILLDLTKIPVYVIARLVTHEPHAMEYSMRVEGVDIPDTSDIIGKSEISEKKQGIMTMIFLDFIKRMTMELFPESSYNTSFSELPEKNILIEALGEKLSLNEDQINQLQLLLYLFKIEENNPENSLTVEKATSFIKNNITTLITLSLQYLRSLNGKESSPKKELKVKGKRFLKDFALNFLSGQSGTRANDGPNKKKPIGRILKECANKSFLGSPKDSITLDEENRQKIVEALDKYCLRDTIEKLFSDKLILWLDLFGYTNEGISVKLLNGMQNANLKNSNLETIVDVVADILIKIIHKYKE